MKVSCLPINLDSVGIATNFYRVFIPRYTLKGSLVNYPTVAQCSALNPCHANSLKVEFLGSVCFTRPVRFGMSVENTEIRNGHTSSCIAVALKVTPVFQLQHSLLVNQEAVGRSRNSLKFSTLA